MIELIVWFVRMVLVLLNDVDDDDGDDDDGVIDVHHVNDVDDDEKLDLVLVILFDDVVRVKIF